MCSFGHILNPSVEYIFQLRYNKLMTPEKLKEMKRTILLISIKN